MVDWRALTLAAIPALAPAAEVEATGVLSVGIRFAAGRYRGDVILAGTAEPRMGSAASPFLALTGTLGAGPVRGQLGLEWAPFYRVPTPPGTMLTRALAVQIGLAWATDRVQLGPTLAIGLPGPWDASWGTGLRLVTTPWQAGALDHGVDVRLGVTSARYWPELTAGYAVAAPQR